MKYKYKSETFKVSEIINIPDGSIVIKSSYDSACNHHAYERKYEDTIFIQWLEPIKEE